MLVTDEVSHFSMFWLNLDKLNIDAMLFTLDVSQAPTGLLKVDISNFFFDFARR